MVAGPQVLAGRGYPSRSGITGAETIKSESITFSIPDRYMGGFKMLLLEAEARSLPA